MLVSASSASLGACMELWQWGCYARGFGGPVDAILLGMPGPLRHGLEIGCGEPEPGVLAAVHGWCRGGGIPGCSVYNYLWRLLRLPGLVRNGRKMGGGALSLHCGHEQVGTVPGCRRRDDPGLSRVMSSTMSHSMHASLQRAKCYIHQW